MALDTESNESFVKLIPRSELKLKRPFPKVKDTFGSTEIGETL